MAVNQQHFHLDSVKDEETCVVDHVDYQQDPKPTDTGQQPDKFGSVAKVDPKEIALVKKLDMYLMPILWLMYFLNFLDRNAIVNGKLNNLDKDLNMVGSQYNTYITGQIPSNMLVTRVKPAWYMSGWMMAWAIVSTLICVVKDYHGMLACRLVLGITEAPFYSGACYMVSLFYTRKETATRLAVFYTGNLLASSFSGLIAAGVFAGLDGKHGLAGWRWLFLIQGVVTVGVAVVAFFMLPNAPLQTRWLTPEQRQLAHDRVARDTTEKRQATSAWSGLWEAATDYRTWVFALMGNLHLSANGFKNYMPTAVKSLGFSTTITLVLTCPPYLVAGVTSVLVSWSSGYFNERTWHVTMSKIVASIGFAVATSTMNIGARYFAMVLFVGATYGVNNINVAWTTATVGQTDEKKAAAIAMVNTLGNLSFVYTPYLWPDSDSPLFRMAMLASIGFSMGVVATAWLMKNSVHHSGFSIRPDEKKSLVVYLYLEHDTDEQQETAFGTTEAEHIHYVIKMVDIAQLLGRIMDTHFAPGRGPPGPAEVRDLKQQLEQWKQSLPDDMRRGPEEGQPSVLTHLIHLAYNHLRILVHRNGWLRNRDEEDKKAALAAACRISRITEDMLAQKTLQYGQMHLLTSLFAALCIHAIDIRSADGIGRRLAEHRAQMCLLGLKEIQKYWRINNNVLDLFLQYLDESIAKRLNNDNTESAPLNGDQTSPHASGISPLDPTRGTSQSLANDSADQSRTSVIEDQYFNLMRTNWEGEDALGDLGLFLDPQLYANGPMQVEGLNFLQRCL
ncbi:major facilitator superfamily transporter [Colletotrichum karsti]|uniref:Major facilitator superfamily transporter n=1 Tax=Colletotrichum karsti TaxID=1095194 RepID=A0A9P6LFN2_9PEZI|nr:major facilitator superfamily transporter [Colletotrichum karsti]KAF9870750.1 major facilitator superfamily transporter [Colletotrichum karsti]